MEGQGSIEHLEALLANPETAPRYSHLYDDDREWTVRDDVYVRYNEWRRIGKLTTGFGFRTHKFGPELEFGHVVGNVHDETVLIIKTTFGGCSLAADFRPPSSGEAPFDWSLMDDHCREFKASNGTLAIGHRYHEMMYIINDTLSDITKVIPDYDGSGYDILGFLWFQGFSDLIDKRKVAEYDTNLRNLLDDVRKELNMPDLPITIGELGMQGTKPDEHHTEFRAIQRNVAETYNGKIVFAEVSPNMVIDPITDGFDFDGPGQYHYNGRADNYIEIGRVLAEAALSLNSEEDGVEIVNHHHEERAPDSIKDRAEEKEEEEGNESRRRQLRGADES